MPPQQKKIKRNIFFLSNTSASPELRDSTSYGLDPGDWVLNSVKLERRDCMKKEAKVDLGFVSMEPMNEGARNVRVGNKGTDVQKKAGLPDMFEGRAVTKIALRGIKF